MVLEGNNDHPHDECFKKYSRNHSIHHNSPVKAGSKITVIGWIMII